MHNCSEMTSPNPSSIQNIDLIEANNVVADGQQLYLHNSKTNMSSLNSPKLFFPKRLPSPTGIPVRAPPQFPTLDNLDKKHGKYPDPIEVKGYTYPGKIDTAYDTLNKHIASREPFVEVASRRLQAAVGVRNEAPFDLPGDRHPPKRSLKSIRSKPEHLLTRSSTDKGGMNAKSHKRGGRRDSGLDFSKRTAGLWNIDMKTGKGLREFLLQQGRECGMRKQECKSISFHDFTPDMRTGMHQNVLLGHYTAEEGERVDVYEVDLSATQQNDLAGEEFATTETWLWILISRPLISYDPTDASTYVPPSSPSIDSHATDVSSTPQSAVPAPEPTLKPTPPNFPHPTPLSWVVFAAPKAHVATYPETVENHDGDGSIAQFPFTSPSKTVHKRNDYDFSFSGIPLFEFSSGETFSVGIYNKKQRPEFLSIESMGGFYESDLYKPYGKEEYLRHCQLWRDGEWPPGQWAGIPKKQRYYDDDVHGMPRGSMPPPNRGAWWKSFYDRMGKDVERWKKIKTCMGRGKCRVVVRWIEPPQDETMEDQVDVRWEQGGRWKQGVGAGSKKVMQGKRKMMADSRRRSGLGVIREQPAGLGIDGVVDGEEDIKTSAVGKRELGSGGRVADKEMKRKRG